jgi:hypothetical protein
MRFEILPDGDGFLVQWSSLDNGQIMGEFRGFATHQLAQAFVQDFTIKLVRSTGGH